MAIVTISFKEKSAIGTFHSLLVNMRMVCKVLKILIRESGALFQKLVCKERRDIDRYCRGPQ